MKTILSEIISIEEVEEINSEPVYDIEIEEHNNMFFGNDILVHNSCHSCLKPVLDILDKPLLNKDNNIASPIYDIVNELNDHLNTTIIEWAKTHLNSTDPRFYFKREAICSAGLYQAKKHYILHVRDKGKREPLQCNYIKPVGVELVRSTVSSTIKEMITRVVKTLLNTRDRDATLDVYREIYQEFKKLPPEEIASRSGVATYNKYAEKANGFVLGKHTPIAVAGAIFHNNLLKKLNIEDKYDVISSGVRVKWVYCIKTNKYGIDKIAFLNTIPEEFSDIHPDYEKMFQKIIQPAIERLFECANWKFINLNAEYAVDLFDFFGV